MKKVICLAMSAVLAVAALTACSQTGEDGTTAQNAGSSFDSSKMIGVVSREDGSGTRTAFIELFGLEEEGADGSKKDMTTKEATIASKTDVMLTQVAGSPYAIGYVSMGSLNDTIKALKIDGAEPTVENVKSGTYKVVRPFMIAAKKNDDTNAALKEDFIGFIMSEAGQKVVEENSYISIDDVAAFESQQPSGKLAVGGSSSVTPVMEKLKEAYAAVNPNADIEVQQTDSSSGLTAAIEGSLDIAMASRDLKEDEKAQLDEWKIALDGIAVIVNKENPVEDLTTDAVAKIFKGEAETWEDVSA